MPDQHEARLGQHIGEYRLVHKLGGGGFGTVYLAEHIHNHTQVALKLLHIPLTKSEDFRDFINEASTIRLRHPHIIPLLNFGISRGDLPFLVMEYAPQGTLRDRHPIGERVPLSTVVSYVDQLASALQYAHDERIIHRDIKPANILIRTDGTLMVSDFGIAKLLEQSVLISQQTQVGTPMYMAPEQYMGHPCFASDQYALAVVIYEWICGVRPFQGPAIGLAVQHINTPPPPLRNHLPELSEAVERVILKALAKAPEDRFGRIQDMASALREAMQLPIALGHPTKVINATPLTTPEQTPQPPFSHQQDASKTVASLTPQKRLPRKRSTLLIGGTLGLASLLIALTIILNPTILATLIKPTHTPSPATISPGLVGWWTFNTNAVSGTTVLDQSGQGNNGHIIPGPPLQQPGKCDQGMLFNGSNWIKIPESPSTIITSSFTIEAWMQLLTTGPEDRNILWKADPRPGLDPYFMYINGTNAVLGFDDNQNIRHQVNTEIGNYITQGFFYLTGVFDAKNQTLAIYANGIKLVETNQVTQTPLTDQDGMTIFIGGMDHDNHNTHGILDEVRLYSRALTLNEIKADMQQC